MPTQKKENSKLIDCDGCGDEVRVDQTHKLLSSIMTWNMDKRVVQKTIATLCPICTARMVRSIESHRWEAKKKKGFGGMGNKNWLPTVVPDDPVPQRLIPSADIIEGEVIDSGEEDQ